MDVQQEKETEKERRGQGVQGRAQPSDLAGGPAGLASHLLHGAPALPTLTCKLPHVLLVSHVHHVHHARCLSLPRCR